MVDSRLIESFADLRTFLPPNLPDAFTNADLAAAPGNNYRHAQSITYVLRKVGVIEEMGKQGRSVLYRVKL